MTVTVNAGGGNQAPTAVNDAYSTAQDTPLSVAAPGVLGNDSDADSDPITVADPRTNAPTSQGGSVTLNSNGSFSYTLASGFSGTDTFTYTATDGTGHIEYRNGHDHGDCRWWQSSSGCQ